MVSECTFHPLPEQFPVGLMMRLKNVGVAHLRAFRKKLDLHTWASGWHRRLKGQNAAMNVLGNQHT